MNSSELQFKPSGMTFLLFNTVAVVVIVVVVVVVVVEALEGS